MSSDLIYMLWESFLETLLMVGVAGTLGAAVGIPLGILLYSTASGGIRPAGLFNL